jgi:NADH-quinone oxidoreductase subunit G
LDYADVILPIAPFTENAGTLVNIEGHYQSFVGATLPREETRPAWKVLRVLSHFLKVEGMEYASLEEVSAEIRKKARHCEEQSDVAIQRSLKDFKSLHCFASACNDAITYLFPPSTNRADPLVRRAASLQARPENRLMMVLNTKTAHLLGHKANSLVQLKQNDIIIKLPVEVSETVADNVVLISAGFAELIHFDPHAPFEVEHVC